MTVISDLVENVAGAADNQPIVFYAERLRDNATSSGMVTPTRHSVMPVDGEFTTPDMDPGQARVRVGSTLYPIVIPESETPVRLGPLIDAGMPPPAVTNEFVKNGGGIARAQRITAAAYAALTTPDPETLYVVMPD